MAEAVLFHHVLGLTEGILELARWLRSGGHVVHTPDMYGGLVFGTLQEGMAHVKSIGFQAVGARGASAAEALGADLVYLGYSLGAAPAQMLAQTRPGARGAVLIAGCLPPEEFGGAWPAAVPLQIHAEEKDPEFDNGYDLPVARSLVAGAADGELFLYPGDRHFFLDSSTPEYDPAPADLAKRRILAFLDRLS